MMKIESFLNRQIMKLLVLRIDFKTPQGQIAVNVVFRLSSARFETLRLAVWLSLRKVKDMG
jgi:hypothetical protein